METGIGRNGNRFLLHVGINVHLRHLFGSHCLQLDGCFNLDLQQLL
jgi:hypothetical protein